LIEVTNVDKMDTNKIIDKTSTHVEIEYIWLSANDNEMPANLECVNIEGVLQLDEWDDSFVDFIKVNNIKGLELKGDRFETTLFGLSILNELTELKYLRISGKYIKSEYKVIETLDKLEELSIADYEAYELDFSRLKYLKSYFSPIRHNDHPIFDCQTIEYIGTNTTLDNFKPFTKLTGLKKIYMFAKKISTLNGIEKLLNLQSLEIDYGYNLDNISALEDLNQLKELSLYACKKIVNVDKIAKITNLRYFSFDECGIIESLTPLIQCKFLKYVSFGNTTIKDGDLECLTKIKTLQGVFFKNKIHYNKNIDDFKKYNLVC